jgi:small ribosomal subunit Rsm22
VTRGWTVPGELEAAVVDAARAELGDAPLATGALVRAIVDRSRRYTSERERLAAPTDAAGDLAARAAFFTVADAMKIAVPLGELVGRGALPPRRPLRVVDVGAGCGAMTLGCIASLAGREKTAKPPGAEGQGAPTHAPVDERAALPGVLAAKTPSTPRSEDRDSVSIDVVAIDRDARALAIAGRAIRQLADVRGVDAKVTTKVGDVAKAAIPPADLVVLGSVLNELSPQARLDLVERALAAIADDGAVIVIEPALREQARDLHAIRDAIIARGTGHVFAPCTRRIAPCTALLDERDWCHEDRPLALPPRTAELARLTHLRDAGMKFSYLVLRKQPLALVEAPDAWRVVSAPMPAKGKLEIVGCGERGRVRLRLLRRHRADDNRDFERADRGDVVAVDAPVEEDRVEIVASSHVDRIAPARSSRDDDETQ